MERCDFSSVITTIRKYISDDRNLNQIDLLYEMFVSFLSDDASQDFDFDNGLVCRWFNGQAKSVLVFQDIIWTNITRNALLQILNGTCCR